MDNEGFSWWAGLKGPTPKTAITVPVHNSLNLLIESAVEVSDDAKVNEDTRPNGERYGTDGGLNMVRVNQDDEHMQLVDKWEGMAPPNQDE